MELTFVDSEKWNKSEYKYMNGMQKYCMAKRAIGKTNERANERTKRFWSRKQTNLLRA